MGQLIAANFLQCFSWDVHNEYARLTQTRLTSSLRAVRRGFPARACFRVYHNAIAAMMRPSTPIGIDEANAAISPVLRPL